MPKPPTNSAMAAILDPPTIQWKDDHVEIIDQTKLPGELAVVQCTTAEQMAEAIRSLRIRGAPAIGIAAAYGVILGIGKSMTQDRESFHGDLEQVMNLLRSTRPTAVNLVWALDRLRNVARQHGEEPVPRVREALLEEALLIHRQDARLCEMIGLNGQQLIGDGARVLTHCNAGRLATGGIGTALGILYTAHRLGKRISVYADETRPLLQGARLTVWELMRAGIPVTLLCDNAAGRLMAQKKVDCALVGADRIAANGDVANKIGTYGVAVLCRQHGLPLYVAAPSSTLDLGLENGAAIPIEERAAGEVTEVAGTRIAPCGVPVYNPAFDVTPAQLVSAIVTEAGVFPPPYSDSLSRAEGPAAKKADSDGRTRR
jgi:methylthioribose-1-phosphate isomerase